VFTLSRALRRAMFVLRIKVMAWWHRSKVDVQVAPDVRIGRGVRVEMQPRIRMTIRLGSGCRLDDGTLLLLKGGSIDCGPEVWFRRDVILNVSGDLSLEGGNILSWGAVVHCADSVRLERFASAAEGVTVSDSTHYYTTPDEFFYQNTRTNPVVIGANTWLCPKATVTSGVHIGSHCILASNSVAIADIPDGHLASGVPASDVRPLRLPWTDRDLAEAMSHGG
jgi:acetyltransferase-like isoleucine patch superfamily enzyme